MKRRDFLLGGLAASVEVASQAATSELSVEGYIFQQMAERRKQPLGKLIPEFLATAKAAGFPNVELNPEFFSSAIRAQTLAKLTSLNLRSPSVYVGGAMHSEALSNQTIERAVEHARLLAPFGCHGLVTNPDPKPQDEPKTDDELKTQAGALNRMAAVLAKEHCELRIHHHTPQLEHNAREWRHILANTDQATVKICVDVDWAYEGDFKAVPFLEIVGDRLKELHIRSARQKIWLEDVEPSDIDYREVFSFLKSKQLAPLMVVELAYRPQTVVTRTLEDDLRRSRIYVEDLAAAH